MSRRLANAHRIVRGARRAVPRPERLEGRALLATIPVTQAGDSGPGSLREAILRANTLAGPDQILFQIPAATDPALLVPAAGFDPIRQLWTIALLSPLPAITDQLVLDGYSQGHVGVPFRYATGGVANAEPSLITSRPNSIPALQGFDAQLRLVIDGSAIASAGPTTGIDIRDTHSIVRGLAVVSFDVGIRVVWAARAAPIEPDAVGVVIDGSAIGGYFAYHVHPESGEALPGAEGVEWIGPGNRDIGVLLEGMNATLGGHEPKAANLIVASGSHGVRLVAAASGNQVIGNQIGAAGPALGLYYRAPNGGDGILVEGPGNVIGGARTRDGNRKERAGNLITGNAGHGIHLLGSAVAGTRVEGNFVGVGPGGGLAYGSGMPGNGGDGLRIESARDSIVGGPEDFQGNVFSGNGGSGARITGATATRNRLENNVVGLTADAAAPLGNAYDGVLIESAFNTVGAGNVISANLRGVRIAGPGARFNLVEDSFLGTDGTGVADLGNAREGIRIENGACDNVVRGTAPGRQLISGNDVGVLIAAAASVEPGGPSYGNPPVPTGTTPAMRNWVTGNTIGADVQTTVKIGNARQGVWVHDSGWNTIGGAAPGAGNLVLGSDQGVVLEGAGTVGTLVAGNTITASAEDGVRIVGASRNTVGGATGASGNVIRANGGDGVHVVSGADIAILTNAIAANGKGATEGLGIRLDPGANGDAAAPLLSKARGTSSRTIVSGCLEAPAGTHYLLQFFATARPLEAGSGPWPDGLVEGEAYLGSVPVTAGTFVDADGTVVEGTSFTATLTLPVRGGDFVTVTATRIVLVARSDGGVAEEARSSSAFSNPFPVQDASTTVTTTGDSGPGSLRQAIRNANENDGPDLIDFAIPSVATGGEAPVDFDVSTQTWHIRLLAPLDPITQEVVIDGYTQRATAVVNGITIPVNATVNDLAVGDNAKLRIVLDGGGTGTGLLVRDARAEIRGLAIHNFNVGVSVEEDPATADRTAGGTRIQGNAIGRYVALIFDPLSGTIVPVARGVGNSTAAIRIGAGVRDVGIGGEFPAERNQIAANGVGLQFDAGADGALVAGNHVGLLAWGDDRLFASSGNAGAGVLVRSKGVTIGGLSATARNRISSNQGGGIVLSGSGASENRVVGNFVGVGLTGLNRFGQFATGNAGAGIVIDDAGRNTIGGASPGAGNLVSANVGAGLRLHGASASGNVIEGNTLGSDLEGARWNYQASGVAIEAGASGNTIGGLAAGTANTIAYHLGDGVAIGSGARNAVLDNAIFENDGLALAIGAGAQADARAPELDSVTSDGTRTLLAGLLHGEPGATYTLLFFTGPEGDDPEEGRTRLAMIAVHTGLDGMGTFSVTVPTGLALDRPVTATATRQESDGGHGSTSAYVGPARVGPITVAGTVYVTNTSDVAIPGSLRAAILAANTNPGPERIAFRIPGTGPHTILVRSELEALTDLVVIDGFSQPGAAPNSVPVARHELNEAPDLVLMIELSGIQAPVGTRGLVFRSDPKRPDLSVVGSRVAGLRVRDFKGDGIVVDAAAGSDSGEEGVHIYGCVVEANTEAGLRLLSSNNRIGGNTEAFRTIVQGNGLGIAVEGPRGTGNRIEGTFVLDNVREGILITTSNTSVGDGRTEGALNVVSGNASGIVVRFEGTLAGAAPQGNEVLGNLIGTGIEAYSARPNRLHGIWIDGSPGNRIGGPGASARNVIAGQGLITYAPGASPVYGTGLLISGANATRNRVEGNFVGFNEGERLALFLGNQDGIRIQSAANTIGGAQAGSGNVLSANLRHGLVLDGEAAARNVVLGNVVGANRAGGVDAGNALAGLLIANAPDNTIGGTSAGAGNLLSGNDAGLVLDGEAAMRNWVAGNRIGTDATGAADLGNAREGVRIRDASGNRIGPGNVIGGNNVGVRLLGAASTGNRIEGNAIGTDAMGAIDLGNATDGVRIEDGSGQTIGGLAAGAGNRIRYNLGDGVRILRGSGHAVQSNAFEHNGGLPIDLGGDGSTANDAGDPDEGPNGLQNFPELIAVLGAGALGSIQGRLDGRPQTTYLLQFFTSTTGGGTEGLLLSASTTTASDGHVVFAFDLPGQLLPAGMTITATATDPAGNTSEQSPALSVEATQVEFAVETTTVGEGGGHAIVTVTRSGSLAGNVSVEYVTAPGTARTGSDFSATTGRLWLAAGQPTASFVVPLVDDRAVEGDETFQVTLGAPGPGCTLGTRAAAAVTIRDDDLWSVAFAAASVTVVESSGKATITVVRSGASGVGSVRFTTQSASALASRDYVAVTGTLTFAAGELSRRFEVPILSNDRADGDRALKLVLSEPAGLVAGTPETATLTIRDDDSPASFAFAAASVCVAENAGEVRVEVRRAGGGSRAADVPFALVDGSAQVGDDYEGAGGVLRFEAGEVSRTLAVPIRDDRSVEGAEEFAIVLGTPSEGAIAGASTVAVTIVDDDRDREAPSVVDIQPLGAAGGIGSVRLVFSEPLDPRMAVELWNYDGQVVGADSDGRFGTRDDRSLRLAHASYDEGSRSVTLTPAVPLPPNGLYRVRINRPLATGAAAQGVTDRAGNQLDGDGDGQPGGSFEAAFGLGTRLAYVDRDGDQVRLQLQRGEAMAIWLAGDGTVRRWDLLGAMPGRSRVTGTIRRSRGSDGRTRLPAPGGASGVAFGLKRPAFVVGSVPVATARAGPEGRRLSPA